MREKTLLIIILIILTLLLSSACGGGTSPAGGGSSSPDSSGSGTETDTGSNGTVNIYYLNFMSEKDQQWQVLAKLYTEQTGIQTDVITAAPGQYETILNSEMSKSNPPTLFQVDGPVSLADWRDHCYDLNGTPILGELRSPEFTLKDDNAVAGIAYVVETYGIIFNKELLQNAGYSQDDINNFTNLNAVAEDISARAGELGFAAFTSAGMDPSSDTRFTTHLANMPVYYEYKARGISSTDAIEGLYLDNYKMIWDLYINNSTAAPAMLSTKTGADAVREFVTGQGVFYQNGTWAYGEIAEIGDENLGMLPIYIGAQGEEKQGLCTGSENYWCVNANASPENIQATLDFIYWCVTSEEGVNALCIDMDFVIPFKKNLPSQNPLINIANDYIAAGKTPVSWTFTTMPSEEWKNGVGSELIAYAAGTAGWDRMHAVFVDGWRR
jgi:raffinose/stachyose/melibiose transport system substrate-binding protein